MYRIIKIDGTELGITDSVNYIKIGASGDFAFAPEQQAIGVAFNSVAYNLVGHSDIEGADTVVVSAIDGGAEVNSIAKLGMTDDEYVAAVDNGSYKNFVRDSQGFGLAQWTYWSRKEALLAFAKAARASIGDLDMQLNFLWKELSEGYRGVLSVLMGAQSVLEASNSVLLNFERPANQSESVQAKRASYGQIYYDKYAGDMKD